MTVRADHHQRQPAGELRQQMRRVGDLAVGGDLARAGGHHAAREFRVAGRQHQRLEAVRQQVADDAGVEEVISHLQRAGLLGPDADIDDVLSLKVQTQLERRLQTVVYRKGLARSPKQARRLITHGHIAIAGRRVNIPGYHVTRTDETQVAYYGKSPLVSDSHAEKVRIAKPASNPKPAPGGFGGYPARGGRR